MGPYIRPKWAAPIIIIINFLYKANSNSQCIYRCELVDSPDLIKHTHDSHLYIYTVHSQNIGIRSKRVCHLISQALENSITVSRV